MFCNYCAVPSIRAMRTSAAIAGSPSSMRSYHRRPRRVLRQRVLRRSRQPLHRQRQPPPQFQRPLLARFWGTLCQFIPWPSAPTAVFLFPAASTGLPSSGTLRPAVRFATSVRRCASRPCSSAPTAAESHSRPPVAHRSTMQKLASNSLSVWDSARTGPNP